MGSESDRTGGLIRETGKTHLSLPHSLSAHSLTHTDEGKAKWEHKVKAAVSKPERKLS